MRFIEDEYMAERRRRLINVHLEMCSHIELSAYGRRVGVRYDWALCGSSKTTCSHQVWPRSTRVKRMLVLPQESHASSLSLLSCRGCEKWC